VNLAEGVQIVSFGLLALMMIGSALGVVLFSNIVYSAFLLGAVFTSMAGMYLLLNADFVAAAQLLIYVGSVNVLILFAIMLVNKREDFAQVANTTLRKVLTAVVGLGLFALLGTMILSTPWPVKSGAIAGGASPVEAIGQHFFHLAIPPPPLSPSRPRQLLYLGRPQDRTGSPLKGGSLLE
jgi:NAD(P)H-quinone oxidoreductase subunit 6